VEEKDIESMTADNILEFDIQVMRAMATLYKYHPNKTVLSTEQMLAAPISPTDPEYYKQTATITSTIQWLLQNGFITGTFDERFPAILDAQLPESTLRTLSANEPNAQNHQTLGELAISAASQPGTREESVVAELVVCRLQS
jgi:hypothetical protein